MKLKARCLLNLNAFPRLNKKKSFWRWYFIATEKGSKNVQQLADNMVLYTNISKTTAFYRMFVEIRDGKDKKIKER